MQTAEFCCHKVFRESSKYVTPCDIYETYKNSRFCLLVGDSHSIKKAKEVINELLNLDPPASNATSASAQPKNAPKLKPKPKPQLVKKLPPMPTEPKPVGQVSRFSLLIPGDSNQDDLSDGATANDSNSDCEPIQKDDWLPRETKNSKKKKKERKRSEKSDKKSDNSEKQQQQLPTKSMKTEKNPVCQKETSKPTPKPPTPQHNSESTNSTTQSKKKKSIPPKITPPPHTSSNLSAEEDVKTPTGSSALDQDFLKTSQNLDLEEFRKSLEQINNSGFENGNGISNFRNGSISSLGQSDDSICDSLKTSTIDGVTDLSLYSIQGTISNLQGKLIQGLKGIESKEYCFKIFMITR